MTGRFDEEIVLISYIIPMVHVKMGRQIGRQAVR